jgi:hypothetical protein
MVETHKSVPEKPSIATATLFFEQISVSRAKPLRGAEGALDALICSEATVAVAIDGANRNDACQCKSGKPRTAFFFRGKSGAASHRACSGRNRSLSDGRSGAI